MRFLAPGVHLVFSKCLVLIPQQSLRIDTRMTSKYLGALAVECSRGAGNLLRRKCTAWSRRRHKRSLPTSTSYWVCLLAWRSQTQLSPFYYAILYICISSPQPLLSLRLAGPHPELCEWTEGLNTWKVQAMLRSLTWQCTVSSEIG